MIKILLIVILFIYLILYINNIIKTKEINNILKFPSKLKYSLMGLITNFFDFLGIGSYATQTLFLKSDEEYSEESYLIPGTLSVGNLIPTITQALIALTVLQIDFLTISSLAISAGVGSYVGSKFIKKENNLLIGKVLAFALLVTGILLMMNAFDIPPFNNIETNLTGLSETPVLLLIAIVIYFFLGLLQSFGLGMYAPGFAVLGLMGMSYIYIMPINMVSTVVLSLSNSIEFISKDKFIKPISFYVLIFGTIGVVMAAAFAYIIDFTNVVGILQIIIAIIALFTSYKMFINKQHN